MMKKEHITAALFILLLGGLCLANFLHTPPEISQSERRRLRTIPPLTAQSVWDGQYMSDFDRYASDAFVARDGFRSVKAAFSRYVWLQTDNHDLFIRDGSAAQLTRLDEAAAETAADKITRLASRLPESSRFYYAVIPDKGFYMQGFPKADYARLDALLSGRLGPMTAIGLRDVMGLEDFYRTDLHWDQSRLSRRVLPRLTDALGVPMDDGLYAEEIGPFQGAYAGQVALPMPTDSLTVLRSPAIDGLTARYLDAQTGQWKDGPVYNAGHISGIDPYDVFLEGAQPLIVLDNPSAATDRELVLFRDSFGSSLAPLLASSYRRVTVADMRYIPDQMLFMLLEAGEDADVLFLFGLQSINISATWRA